MKQTVKILIFLIIISNQSCLNSDCEDDLYVTAPRPINFELVDKSTNKNLFTNRTYESSRIEILNISDNSIIEHSFIKEDAINIIQISSIGWESEIIEGSLRINGSEIFRFYIKANRLSENCSTFTRYDEFRIENTDYEFDYQLGVYKILIETKKYDCIIGEADSIISSDQILGEWKLMQERKPWIGGTYDYSNDNIIFNFQSDGILVVKGNEYYNRAFSNGEYNYVLEKDNLSNFPSSEEPKNWIVKINGSKWHHLSQNKLMQLGQSDSDGNDYCFERQN